MSKIVKIIIAVVVIAVIAYVAYSYFSKKKATAAAVSGKPTPTSAVNAAAPKPGTTATA